MESKFKKCTIHKKTNTNQKNNFIKCASVPTSNDINLIESKNKCFFKQLSNAHCALDETPLGFRLSICNDKSEYSMSLPEDSLTQSTIKKNSTSKMSLDSDHSLDKSLTCTILKKENKVRGLKDALAEKKNGGKEILTQTRGLQSKQRLSTTNENSEFKYVRSTIKKKKNNSASRLYSNLLQGTSALNANVVQVKGEDNKSMFLKKKNNESRKLVSRPNDMMLGMQTNKVSKGFVEHDTKMDPNAQRGRNTNFKNLPQTNNETSSCEYNDKTEKTEVDGMTSMTQSSIIRRPTVVKKKNLRPNGGLKLVSSISGTSNSMNEPDNSNNSNSDTEIPNVTEVTETSVAALNVDLKKKGELNFVDKLEKVYKSNLEKMCEADTKFIYLDEKNLCLEKDWKEDDMDDSRYISSDAPCTLDKEKSFMSEIILMSTRPLFLSASNDLFLAPTSGSVFSIATGSSGKNAEFHPQLQTLDQAVNFFASETKEGEEALEADVSESQNICLDEHLMSEIYNNEVYIQLKNEIQERYDNESEEVTCQLSEKSDFSQSGKKPNQESNNNNNNNNQRGNDEKKFKRFFEIDDCNVEMNIQFSEAGSDLSSMSEETNQATNKKNSDMERKSARNDKIENVTSKNNTLEKKTEKNFKTFSKSRGAKKSLPTRFLPVGNSRTVV